MLREETIRFLANVSPFELLPQKEFDRVIDDVSLEYFPKGSQVLMQGGPPSEFLYIIKRGVVRISMTGETGREITIDYRGEGEHFGLLSLLGGDHSRNDVTAQEDTIAYLIPKEQLLAVLKQNPAVHEHFLSSFFINFIDRTQEETRRRFTELAGGDKALFTLPVGEISRRRPVTIGGAARIRHAAQTMVRERVSCLIVTGDDGVPTGIVTDRDLREKVVATGSSLDGPVEGIVSSPVIAVDSEEHCFEALLLMMRHEIHHLLVTDGGFPSGVLTNHDLLVLQGSSPMLLVKEVEGIRDLDRLADTAAKIHRIVSTLLREGARAHSIAGIITELTEKVLSRLVELAEKKIGPPPLPAALFACGDGGRRELTLRRTLVLGVVFADSDDEEELAKAREYFGEFREIVSGTMPLCRPDSGHSCLEAENVRSFTEWARLFDGWATTGEMPPGAADFFDMRPATGRGDYVLHLRHYLFEIAGREAGFTGELLAGGIGRRPPLGFVHHQVVEQSGEQRSELDLYEKGLKPLVEAVRLLAVAGGIEYYSTRRRAAELARRGFEYGEEIEQALEYLLTLLIHHQLDQVEEGGAPDNFIEPESLSNLEKKTLKETFQLTGKLYDILAEQSRNEVPGK